MGKEREGRKGLYISYEVGKMMEKPDVESTKEL